MQYPHKKGEKTANMQLFPEGGDGGACVWGISSSPWFLAGDE
jgi:hypothetical protein